MSVNGWDGGGGMTPTAAPVWREGDSSTAMPVPSEQPSLLDEEDYIGQQAATEGKP